MNFMDVKQHILSSAASLFAQKGYAAVSIREIARMASVNVAMVYYYFKSKESLLQRVLLGPVTAIVKETEQLLGADRTPIEKLHTLVDTYAQHLCLNKQVSLVFFHEQMNRSSEIVGNQLLQLTRRSQEAFQEIIKEGQQRSLFSKDADASMLYITLLGTCQQLLAQDIALPVSREPEFLGDYLKRTIDSILSLNDSSKSSGLIRRETGQ